MCGFNDYKHVFLIIVWWFRVNGFRWITEGWSTVGFTHVNVEQQHHLVFMDCHCLMLTHDPDQMNSHTYIHSPLGSHNLMKTVVHFLLYLLLFSGSLSGVSGRVIAQLRWKVAKGRMQGADDNQRNITTVPWGRKSTHWESNTNCNTMHFIKSPCY